MNKFCFFVLFQLSVVATFAQVQTHVVGDSIRLHGNGGKGEFILQNATDSVKGFLYNKGAGRTEFRQALIKINDSLYAIGNDTLRLKMVNNSIPSLQLVTSAGDSTSNRIVASKVITDTLNTHSDVLSINGVRSFFVPVTHPNRSSFDLIGFGDSVFSHITNGNQNVAIGNRALHFNTSGQHNFALGPIALEQNTSGNFNFAACSGALSYNTTGSDNIAFGFQAGWTNSTGSGNVYVGRQAGYQNEGNNNVYLGHQAGFWRQHDNNKLIIANSATITPLVDGTFSDDISAASLTINGSLKANGELTVQNATNDVSGFLFNKGGGATEFRKALLKINANSYLIGADTLTINAANGTAPNLQDITQVGDSTSNRIVARKLVTDSIYTHKNRLWLDSVPIQFLKPNYNYPTTGVYDIISIGDSSLVNNQGRALLAIGTRALRDNTIGNYNTAVGLYSLRNNTEGSYNTALGYSSILKNTTGSYNTAIGNTSLLNNTTGSYNVVSGQSALYNNTSGSTNAVLGYWTMLSNTTGSDNTAFGTTAMRYNISGNGNVALGRQALYYDTAGNYNVAIGYYAGHENRSGSGNIFIGPQAGYNESGSNKLYIANSNTSAPLIGGDFSASTLIFNGSVTTIGKQSFTSTTGTTGSQTINTPSGTVTIASGSSSVVITNNLVTTSSIVMPVIRTDSGATIKNVVPSTGSFTINLTAAATAATSIGFIVFN